jgi:ribulose-5-phosphate 4-epimerase/fuculose-1-phosphate aldolase
MIRDIEIKEYINICVHLGSYHELIQGGGGNFSLKQGEEMIIKSSGRVLPETTQGMGYVICSLPKLLEYSKNSISIDIDSTVLRGEANGIPSMEVFFHLLPYKWVIHVHPTFFLRYLCQPSWKSLKSTYKCSYIDYRTPGKELGLYILEHYDNEQVIFLQNHGIIVCGNTIEEIYNILDSLYSENSNLSLSTLNSNEFIETYRFKEHVERSTGNTIVLKPCKHIKNINHRLFFPITPDIALFLKLVPLVQEDYTTSWKDLFDTYYRQFNILPSILQLGKITYICGKSYHQCNSIEEILESYLDIISNTNISTLTYFDQPHLQTISASTSEIHRLNLI